MADKKITALTDIGTGIVAADLFHVIDDPGGTPVNKKMTVGNFTAYLPSPLGFAQAPQPIVASTGTEVINTTAAITSLTSTGAFAATLGAGTTGMLKFIVGISIAGNVTLTPTTLLGYSTVTFNTTGDTLLLMYLDATSGWTIISHLGCALA